MNKNAASQNVWANKDLVGSNAIDIKTNNASWQGPIINRHRFRPGEKSPEEMDKLIRMHVDPNKFSFRDKKYLYDFTCGTGTTGVVGNKFYLNFVGNDRDPEAAKHTWDRINNNLNLIDKQIT